MLICVAHRVTSPAPRGNSIPDIASRTLLLPDDWSPITAIWGIGRSCSNTQSERRAGGSCLSLTGVYGNVVSSLVAVTLTPPAPRCIYSNSVTHSQASCNGVAAAIQQTNLLDAHAAQVVHQIEVRSHFLLDLGAQMRFCVIEVQCCIGGTAVPAATFIWHHAQCTHAPRGAYVMRVVFGVMLTFCDSKS